MHPETEKGLITSVPIPLALIAACNEDRVIGYRQKIPWRSAKDFRFFRAMTEGSICWMGKNTFLSLPKLLPNRFHVVFSRTPKELWLADWVGRYSVEKGEGPLKVAKDEIESHVTVVDGLAQAIRVTQKKAQEVPGFSSDIVYCIGGAELYRQFLAFSRWIVLTRIKTGPIAGDAFFPDFSGHAQWNLLMQHYDFDEQSKLSLEFNLYYNKELTTSQDSQSILNRFQKALGFEVLA
ncbi:MAG: dihydrofolate reductase [Bdellovibrionaceae bacterium]|nr:dihydrofolate reductase [Pseudobdellovibrionaceae bacterium]MDW8189475.1 dihydrofolate reductase [Pseudobdellovibrionaceae bacterium]